MSTAQTRPRLKKTLASLGSNLASQARSETRVSATRPRGVDIGRGIKMRCQVIDEDFAFVQFACAKATARPLKPARRARAT
jgi:hypothetical protein